MKANELRIGNLIYLSVLSDDKWTFRDEIFTVCATTIRDAVKYGDDWAAKPIPLTEEWLLKLRWKKEKYPNPCVWARYFYTHEYDDRYRGLRKFVVRYEFSGRIKNRKFRISHDECNYDLIYVHQLQNLYFALTGQELEIVT